MLTFYQCQEPPTTNPKPTGKALRKQFARAKVSPLEMIRFGSMVEDLECYVDNRLKFSSPGVISGRVIQCRDGCRMMFGRQVHHS